MGRHKKEVWKQIDRDKRIKPLYEISSWGRIRNHTTGKLLSPDTDKDGYYKVSLQGYSGKKIKKFVHRLVAEYFIENDDPISKTQVNHIDFNKKNDYYKNLEWTTPVYNIHHAVSHHRQLILACQSHGYATMTNDFVDNVCKLFDSGLSIKETLNRLGFYKKDDPKLYETMRGRLKHIRSRKTWTAISRKYKNF